MVRYMLRRRRNVSLFGYVHSSLQLGLCLVGASITANVLVRLLSAYGLRTQTSSLGCTTFPISQFTVRVLPLMTKTASLAAVTR